MVGKKSRGVAKRRSKNPPKKKVGKPRDYDKCVEAAGFLTQGASQVEAAELVGCAQRTIRLWMNSDWWPECMEAANEKWGDAVLAFARRSVLAAVREGEISTARWVLTNLDPRFAKKKDEIDVNITYCVDMPEVEDDGDDEEDEDDFD